MKRLFTILAFISFIFAGPCGTACAMTDEEAYAAVDSLENAVISKQLDFDSAIYFESLKNYLIRKEPSYAYLMFRSELGRPFPILQVRTLLEKLTDATALNVSFIPSLPTTKRRARRALRKEEVSFTLESEGIQRRGLYYYSAPHFVTMTVNATVNEEIDKIGRLAKFCEAKGDVRLSLVTPTGEMRVGRLTELEKSAISETWRYFAAYAHLAKTYSEPAASQSEAVKKDTTDKYYKSRLEELANDYGIPIPSQAGGSGGVPRSSDRGTRRLDERPPAITEVPVRTGAEDDAGNSQKNLSKGGGRLDPQEKMLAEIRRLIAERQAAERQEPLDPERQRLTDQLIDQYIKQYWQM